MTQTDLSLFKTNPYGTKTTEADILDAFEFLDDWEERYSYIIDLGKSLPSFPEADKSEENLVHGCQSQVWIIHKFDDEDIGIFKDAVRLGSISRCVSLDSFNFEPWLNCTLQELRERLGIESELIEAYYQVEKRRYPSSQASQRLVDSL